MQFNSLSFLIFFSLVCLLAALTNTPPVSRLAGPRLRALRQTLLLLASYVFYGWWNWKCCLLMLGLSATAWYCSLVWARSRRKLAVVLGVVIPLLILGIFKYFNFFLDSFCQLFGIARSGALRILLPVGISFYTFQSLSYTIDVYRGRVEAERSFLRVALYISFFPQLVAGPIVKAGDFLPQLRRERTITLRGLERGVQIFAFGLFKKIVLADNISVFVDAVHKSPAAFSALTLLLAAYAYAIQVYCDFSGYSDMAVGCAAVLGYELPRNFNLPYLSKNVTEFWKRWHISLSAWMREYLYYSLGGNRKGRARTYLNLFLTMVICGLWHGAAWTFVAWGTVHGIALCLHKLYTGWRKRRGLSGGPLWGAVSLLLCFNYASLSAVIFRAESLSSAWQILRAIFTGQRGVTFISFWAVVGLLLTAAAEFAALRRAKRLGTPLDGYYPQLKLDTLGGLVLFFSFIGLTLTLAYTGQSPFIYFQF